MKYLCIEIKKMKPIDKINPQMVILARESRGISQKDLASLLHISAGKVCQVEQDTQTFSEDTFTKLCNILHYPESFFFQEGEAFLPSLVNFRKRTKIAQKRIIPIEAHSNIIRLNIEILAKEKALPETNIPVINGEDPVEAAIGLRQSWNIPEGPVLNLIQYIEKNGILIATFDFGTERVDSRTVLTTDRHPVILLNKTLLGDKLRFSLAYELGHIAMHFYSPVAQEREIAHEANLFAAAFLMPESDIKKDFEADINITSLSVLKPKWGVSMQSLLYRADDMGMLPYNRKRYLLSQFNQLKIRRREPLELDIPVEKPVLLYRLMEQLREEKEWSVGQAAGFFHLAEEDYAEKYMNKKIQ